MWLSIYSTDNTYFPKSHFYPSIHVIVAKTQTKKAQLGFNILNKFCSAYKKKKKERKSKPSAKKVTNDFAFLNYISFQLVQRADEWDLLGAQSLQLTFINIAPSK